MNSGLLAICVYGLVLVVMLCVVILDWTSDVVRPNRNVYNRPTFRPMSNTGSYHTTTVIPTSQSQKQANTGPYHTTTVIPTSQPYMRHNQSNETCVITIANKNGLTRYRDLLDSLQCYTNRHGYTLIVVNSDTDTSHSDPKCRAFMQKTHRRDMGTTLKVCVIYHLVRNPGSCSRLLLVDMDILVVAPEKTLDSYFVPGADVVLMRRFHSGELCAGCNMWRPRTTGALELSHKWVEMTRIGRHNLDNSWLIAAVAAMTSPSVVDTDHGIATSNLIDASNLPASIRILPPLLGVIRDEWTTIRSLGAGIEAYLPVGIDNAILPTDLFLHAVKTNPWSGPGPDKTWRKFYTADKTHDICDQFTTFTKQTRLLTQNQSNEIVVFLDRLFSDVSRWTHGNGYARYRVQRSSCYPTCD